MPLQPTSTFPVFLASRSISLPLVLSLIVAFSSLAPAPAGAQRAVSPAQRVLSISGSPAAAVASGASVEFCLLTGSSVQTAATDCTDPRLVAHLRPGEVIPARSPGDRLNLRAHVTGVDVGSVYMELSGRWRARAPRT